MESMKSSIRKQVRKARNALPQESRNSKSKAILDQLACMKNFKRAKHVLAYYATQSEVETYELIQFCLCSGKSLYLPKVKGHSLSVHLIEHLDDLEEGSFAVWEPKAETPTINPKELDCIIVPGVAFDKKGNRLGYGKGYYDSLLKDTNAHKIALAFSEQIVDHIPAESHDIPMDHIVTEDEIITP